ncbi:hypothetical protein PHJA_002322800 [Phtheirospermum japonicum]|uniref:DUF4378 domain-containing protein n=1 Tax=Phtheirospermum japonicum TaxID=374723 RepID=A0A830CW17_9LAMI|nr:hypothetical protein PHJA_002322800 [Phtheirospermum japonicum]
MATKSDFAQKLLNDLRVRKERMAVAQNSSRHSTQTSSRVAHGNTGQTSRGSRQINTQQSAGSTAGNTSSKSININESSNQIVLYGNGQSSRQQQVKDLSMAIAFAFESNGKNLTNIGASNTNNPLVNFFNRFGRKTRDNHKMGITASFDSRSLSTGQFSNVHISEVSKGVQKLNQILRACSNGFSFDGSSIEVGEKLLKGAIDLEESLRMLVNLQDASQYVNASQKKSQLKLLEEEEDDENEDAKIAEQWKLDRPKFSFDKPSRNSRVVRDAKDLSLSTQVVSHKRSTNFVQDLGLSTQVKQNSNNNNNSSSSQSTHDKRRISNVVAKLMGLDEIPKNEDSILKKNGSKFSKQNTKLSEPLNRERNNQQSHTVAANQGNGHQIFDDSRRKQNPTREKQSKITESERKMLVSNTKRQLKAQNSNTPKAEEKTHDSTTEKRNANKDLPRNQRKPQDQHVLVQEHVLKRGEHSEDNRKKEQNGQHFQKQNLTAKNHEGRQVESKTTTKPKKSAPIKKKLSRDESAHGNGKPTEKKVPTKDPQNRTHQDDVPVIDTSQQMVPEKENIQNEEKIHKLDVENENKNLVLTKEKLIEVSGKQKAMIPKKVQRSDIPQKIDVLMSRRNATANHLTRSIKHPANNMLTDLKQRMHNKNRVSKRMEEQSDSTVKDEKEGTSGKMNIEPVKKQNKLQNEDDQSIILESSVADENPIKNVQNTRTLNDDGDTIAFNSEKVSDHLQTVEQPSAFKDEQEIKQCDQSKEDNIEEQRTELYNLSQHEDKQIPASERHEQLTEPEKELKEIVIKSQSFLSTSEALFKLNIPISYLHAAEQDYEVAENKFVLNCAYELMKRKARRHENAYNPYMKATISCPKVRSLDDLIKQLCKDLDTLKFYGGDASDECDVAARLYKMLEKDIYHKDADVNSMWDFEWSNITLLVPEKEDVVRDVERYMLNGLLDEVTNDLLLLTVSV